MRPVAGEPIGAVAGSSQAFPTVKGAAHPAGEARPAETAAGVIVIAVAGTASLPRYRIGCITVT